MVFLGIDCGTQSLKVIAWEAGTGRFVSASRAYDLISNLPPGHKEQDPQVWIDALEQCMAELAQKTNLISGVEAIGISGQQHGLVVLDEHDQVIRPAKLWNDTSTDRQCTRIVEAFGGLDAYRAEIGNSLPPGFTASKLLWIKENEPANYQKINAFFLPHDYLNFYLTGEKVAEAGDASGTGYFDVRNRRWSSGVLTAIDPDRDLAQALPNLISSATPAGQLRSELAERWGVPQRAIASSGGGDNMMGAIGTGNVSTGLMTVSLGTSGTIYSYSDTAVIDPGGEIAAFCDSTGGWLPLGCTMNVTVATEMIRKSLLNVDHQAFSEAVDSIPPGAEGLILLPYLEGERMPPVSQGTGVLLGLRPSTSTPAHLARAAMEGVTLGLEYGLDRLQKLGMTPKEIRLIGGGAKSPVWRQMAADIFNVSVVSPVNEEGPAFGAAIQAMWAHTGEDIQRLAAEHVKLDESTRCAPKPNSVERYRQVSAVYNELADTLIGSPVFGEHRKLIES